MPAIRSRMSSSSSTMRISDAISDPFLLIFASFYVGGLFRPFDVFLDEREGERNLGAPALFLASFGIGEGDIPAMVFHDLAHDRQTQPRALGPGGDVRLGQPVAMLRRQANAIVGDVVGEVGAIGPDGDGDGARLVIALG